MPRRFEGDETWRTLLDWTKEQKASERLAGAILQSEEYKEVDPSHPLGGQDGGKDILCQKDGLTFVGAVYFPRGQQSFKDIKKKFTDDVTGVKKNNADGIVFVTNQELRLGERKELAEINKDVTVELYHLERLTQVLNVPKNYGIRLEYLDIDVTKEEYLAFIANRDDEHYRRLKELERRLDSVLDRIEKQSKDIIGYATGSESLAYFQPEITPGIAIIGLTLCHDESQYPVFDIWVYYEILGSQLPIQTMQCGTLHAGQTQPSVLTVDMTHKDRLAINVTLQFRTKHLTQFFRFFKTQGEIVVAYKTQDLDNTVIHRQVSEKIPGYDPKDPDAVFK